MQTWILLISHHNSSPGTGIMHLSNLPFADLQFGSKTIPNIHTSISSLCFLIKPLLFIQSQLILHLNFWYILAHNTKHLAEHSFSWQPWTPIGINKEQRALFFFKWRLCIWRTSTFDFVSGLKSGFSSTCFPVFCSNMLSQPTAKTWPVYTLCSHNILRVLIKCDTAKVLKSSKV